MKKHSRDSSLNAFLIISVMNVFKLNMGELKLSFIDIIFILICIVVLIICYKLMYSPIVFINSKDYKKEFLRIFLISTGIFFSFSIVGFLMGKIRFNDDFIITKLGEEISNSIVYILLANTDSMENINIFASNPFFTIYCSDWILENSTSFILIVILLLFAFIYNFRMSKIVSDYSSFSKAMEKYKQLNSSDYTHHRYFNDQEKNIISYSFKTNLVLLVIIVNAILLICSLFNAFKLIVSPPYISTFFGDIENIEYSLSLHFLYIGTSEIAGYILFISSIILGIILLMEIYPYCKHIMKRDSFSYNILKGIKSIISGLAYIIILLVLFFWYAILPIIGLILSGGSSGDPFYNDYQHPGYHYVDDYYRTDGTHVRGHWKTNPDEYEWNNLSE
ncbi:hypothetical protein GN156_13235 [bacterium LRH843]|nr:hypothetical protein [bacterium LRH843]